MESTDLQDRYALILERFADELKAPAGLANRRTGPRVPVTSHDVTASITERGKSANVGVETRDMSTSGVCFFADRPFPEGAEVELAVSRIFTLTAVVVSCGMEEAGPAGLEVRYRVRCKFLDEHHGMELLVMAKESEMLAKELGR